MMRRKPRSLLDVVVMVGVEFVAALCVAVAAESSGIDLEEALRRAVKGRSRSRSGPPVVWAHHVPREGAKA